MARASLREGSAGCQWSLAAGHTHMRRAGDRSAAGPRVLPQFSWRRREGRRGSGLLDHLDLAQDELAVLGLVRRLHRRSFLDVLGDGNALGPIELGAILEGQDTVVD